MSHAHVDRSLSAYLDDELAPDERAELEAHLATCAACRATLDDLRATRRLLRALPERELPERFWPELRTRLATPPRSPAAEAARRLADLFRRPAWVATAAALIVLLIGAQLTRGRLERLRAAELGVDLYAREQAIAQASSPLADPAILGVLIGDANLALVGEERPEGRAEAWREAAPAPGPTARPGRAPQGRSLTPLEVLRAALRGPDLIDYEGTKVVTVLRAGSLERAVLAETRVRGVGTRLEYLSPEGIAGRLIVDDGATAWQYESLLHVAIQGPTLAPSDDEIARLARTHLLTLLGLDEVIGRSAYALEVRPRDPGPVARLWVDYATGVVLRTEVLDRERGLVAQSAFTRISFSLNLPESLARFRMPAGARAFAVYPAERLVSSLPQVRQQVGFEIVAPSSLPQGFGFAGGAASRYGGLTSALLRYTDGATVLSLFEVPASRMSAPAGGVAVEVAGRPAALIDMGYLRLLAWEHRGLRLFAVSSLPADALVRLAEAVDEARESRLTAEVAARFGVAPRTVQSLRNIGLTFEQLTRALALSRDTGRPVEQLADEIRSGRLAPPAPGSGDPVLDHLRDLQRRLVP